MIEAATATRAIEAQFPALAPASVAYLGQGYDSVAFAVNGRWVFRFPMREEVEAQLLVERRILPRLLESSPLPLPDFRFHGRPARAFPRHFAGYPMLAGVPGLTFEAAALPPAAARAIGGFLSWLHGWPTSEAGALGVPRQDLEALMAETAEEALADLEEARALNERWPVDAWRRMVERPPASAHPSEITLVHGDLAAEHVLLDEASGTVTGVIDWSEIAIGDPALDLACLYHWGGGTLFHSALAAYAQPGGTAIVDRARFFAACRGAGDIAFGAATKRQAYIAAGVRALELCAAG